MIKTDFLNCSGLAALFASAALAVSCSGDDPMSGSDAKFNPSDYITDTEKLNMLHSLRDIDGAGRLYELEYTVDYRLDDAIKAGVSSTPDLTEFVNEHLFDKKWESSQSVQASFTPGCSAFAVPDAESVDFLMGRNYDFCHTSGGEYVPISAFVVHTAPVGGKKSISFVDGNNFQFRKGMPTDGNSDISLLMALPYGVLDGINEDGFAMGVLSLNEAPTKQNDPGRHSISTTIAIRLLLDRCSTVKQAIDTLRKYNMQMTNIPGKKNNYHYFMADATGDFAIIEYTYGSRLYELPNPSRMEVFTGNDTLRCVTNFYVSPSMVGTKDGWGSEHGKARYETLRNTLRIKGYTLKPDDAMSLLRAVSQPPSTGDPTSQTQWSALYNLTDRTVRLSILREYGKEYRFKVGQVGAVTE